MKIKKNDDTYIDIIPLEAEHDIGINYKLVVKSDKKTVSIDRGASTDRYACEFTFHGATADINTLYAEFQTLRKNNKQVELTECNDNYFGDHISHAVALNCVVGSMNELESKTLNTRVFSVDLIATDVTLQGTATLPILTCLDAGWMGYNEWNTLVNETYNGANYFVNKEADLYVFEGAYILSKDDNSDLLRYWATQRGDTFTISDGDLGIDGMFGPNVNSQSHDVVISNIEYSDYSPTQRQVNIRLFRVGGESLVAPLFTVQPVDQTVAAGATATFGPVTVTGSPTPTLQVFKQAISSFFEAGTVTYPFAGSVGSPVSTDPNWGVLLPGGTLQFNGETATISNSTSLSILESVDKGTVTRYYADASVVGYCSMTCLRNSTPSLNRIYIDHPNNGTFGLYAQRNSAGVQSEILATSEPLHDRYTIELIFDGDDVSYTIEAFDAGVSAGVYTGSIIGAIDSTVQYGACMSDFVTGTSTTYSEVRVEGIGFGTTFYKTAEALAGETTDTLVRPNIGTTGDNFGDQYYWVATNSEGTAQSNTVTTIEA